MLNVKVILGSTREGRFSELLVPWLSKALEENSEMDYEIVDLRDYDMPFYNEPGSPAAVENGDYPNEEVKRFAAKMAEADAFIVVAPEYNHGYSAILKNAMDSIYGEWNNKPVSFVSYGSVAGGRVVEQLRQVAVELQMASTRNAVHIQAPWALRNEDGSLKEGALDEYDGALAGTLEQLEWWGKALKAAR